MISWKNKPLIPDHNRNADDEMVELGLEIHQIIELLENGIDVSKRKKGIVEKWCHRGKIRATKDKLKIMRGET